MKPALLVGLYAALKRRSSTVLHARVFRVWVLRAWILRAVGISCMGEFFSGLL